MRPSRRDRSRVRVEGPTAPPSGPTRRTAMTWSARWALIGLALLVVGVVLALLKLLALAIVVLVLAAAAFRARAWIRKARLLGEVGRGFHVDDDRW